MQFLKVFFPTHSIFFDKFMGIAKRSLIIYYSNVYYSITHSYLSIKVFYIIVDRIQGKNTGEQFWRVLFLSNLQLSRNRCPSHNGAHSLIFIYEIIILDKINKFSSLYFLIGCMYYFEHTKLCILFRLLINRNSGLLSYAQYLIGPVSIFI